MSLTLFNWNARQTKLFFLVYSGLLLLIYYCLHQRYILFNGDDAWCMVRIYHYFTTGLNEDTIFSAVETDEKRQIFYIGLNLLYGNLLNLFGWTKSNGHIISTLLIGGSACLWFLILRQLEFSREVAFCFALSLPLFPAFFGAANLVRPDALTFLLASLSFLLFIRQIYFLSGLILLLAMETHIMGSITAFYIIAYFLTYRKQYFGSCKQFGNVALRFGLGLIVGFFYYYWLHRDVISVAFFRDTLLSYKTMGTKEFKHFFISYFIRPEWYLHVWELFFILISLILYVVNRNFREKPFVWIFFLTSIGASFILSRPNASYMIYMFPTFMLVSFYAFEQRGKLKLLFYTLMVIFCLQYGLVYKAHHSYDFSQIIAKTEATISDKTVAVVGLPDNWYAAKDHPFHLIYNSIKYIPELDLQDLYLIRNDYKHGESLSLTLETKMAEMGLVKDPLLKKRRQHYQDIIQYFLDNYDCTVLNRFPAFKDQETIIYHCKKQ